MSDRADAGKVGGRPNQADSKPQPPPPPAGDMSEAEMLAMLKGFGSQVDYTPDEDGAAPAPSKPPPKPPAAEKKNKKKKKVDYRQPS